MPSDFTRSTMVANSGQVPSTASDSESTCTPWSMAHCIPPMIWASVPPPSGSTSAETMRASGAAPTSLPTISPAVWVPWVSVSRGLVGEALPSLSTTAKAATLPARAGWLASTPVSRCPILTP